MQNYKVNFINSSYRRFFAEHEKEIDAAINDCLSKGRLTLKEDLWQLEKNMAKFVGTKYAAGVNSGTDALFLSLLALGIGKGDEVITVSNTFIATIQAIVHTGATPVLIDIREDEQMNVEQIEKAITKRTKAIIPVHYTGAMCDMESIMKIAKKHCLYVVEDACQAVGACYQGKINDTESLARYLEKHGFSPINEKYKNISAYKGKKAGSFGALGCFSFNTAKLMGGICDGGMVVTNNRKLYEKVCLLRNHYNVHQLSVDRKDYPQPKKMEWAWKSRLSNLNAAFLNVKFKYLPKILRRRQEIASMYLGELCGIKGLTLPHDSDGRIWQEFHIRVKDRKRFTKHMDKCGVETLTRDTTPNHLMEGLGLSHFRLPVTETFAAEVTRLPLYPEMQDGECQYVIKCVKKFFE